MKDQTAPLPPGLPPQLARVPRPVDDETLDELIRDRLVDELHGVVLNPPSPDRVLEDAVQHTERVPNRLRRLPARESEAMRATTSSGRMRASALPAK
jgi:hypothetical protein